MAPLQGQGAPSAGCDRDQVGRAEELRRVAARPSRHAARGLAARRAAQRERAEPHGTAPAASTPTRPIGSSAETGVHQNPFLVPEAARVEHRSRSTRRRMIAALLARFRGLDITRRKVRGRLPVPRDLGGARLTRLAVLTAVGGVAATVIIAMQPDATHPSLDVAFRPPGTLRTAEPALTTAIDSFARRPVARDHAVDRVPRGRQQREIATHHRSRSTSKPTAVTARSYTSPASGSRRSAAVAPHSSSTGSGSAAAVYQSTSSSGDGATSGGSTSGGSQSGGASSSGPRPAFGQNGTLGPGHSPNS